MVMREHSAAPWHDWNERITDECYLPNTAARILDTQGLIRTISNNYSRISSDFGPTLLTWLERARPAVYENILCADTLAQERFSGHGSTIAHPYHHLILPLLSRADKETEVRWGISDFEDRFGRFPEGMWLPEMAVDRETLGVLADHDIRFTLLSPHQARRTGEFLQESASHDGSIDTTVPYLCRLADGKEITIFFQDAALSNQVAFGDLLRNGDRFADHLLSAASREGLVHFATDGETFGHHRTFGEMALSWCLDRIESTSPGTLTNYGEYLARHPPEREIEIVDRTSWSAPTASADGMMGAPVHQEDIPDGTTIGGGPCTPPSRNSRSASRRSFPLRQGRSSAIPGRREMRVSGYSGTGHLNPSKNSSMIMPRGL